MIDLSSFTGRRITLVCRYKRTAMLSKFKGAKGTAILLSMLFLGLAQPSSAQIYSWVDKMGKTQVA
jgi:hypothetical protein